LVQASIRGMISGLDPYCDLFTKEELDKLELSSVGQYVGIGLSVQKKEKQYLVTQVYKNSPADQAGISVGDEIVTIDGVALTEEKNGEINKLLQGTPGSKLVIEFRKHGELEKVKTKTIGRAIIRANSVECRKYNEKIAILTVHQFLKHTAREISECLGNLDFQLLIMDLRNNPGGLLLSSVEVADLFLDIGDIVQIKDRDGRILERYIARKPLSNPKPLFVLVNNNSASAAEIVAGAIKDRKAGVLVGTNSYGKGVVQSIYPVGDDLYIKITTARYFTPSGSDFNGIGIKPDYYVQDDTESDPYAESDRIFQKALELANDLVDRN